MHSESIYFEAIKEEVADGESLMVKWRIVNCQRSTPARIHLSHQTLNTQLTLLPGIKVLRSFKY